MMKEPQTWRCFHCDEVFTDTKNAELHFGRSEHDTPACQIDVAEYRRMAELYRRYCEDDSDLHRALAAKETQMQEAVRRAEELGYARGLRDRTVVSPAGVGQEGGLFDDKL